MPHWCSRGAAHEHEVRAKTIKFVNQFRPPLGRQLTYSNTTDQFDRLSRQLGLAVRPHMLRHTAANSWRRQGGAPRRHARSVRPCVVVVDGALFPSHRF
jgi:integrase